MMNTDYIFLPFIRQGLGNSIQQNVVPNSRATINIEFKVNNNSINKSVILLGPGDVTGFDKGIIVRTDPKNNVGDFEPNYFPTIEIWEEFFPWMMTPLATPVDKKLIPWINLIALKTPDNKKDNEGNDTSEFEFLPLQKDNPVARINVKNIKNSLPDLNCSWAWAHVQITTGDIITTNANGNFSLIELKEIVRNSPEKVISRIICPRVLEPGTLYTAFLVPTFETGRLSALGIPFDATPVNTLAWDSNTNGPLELPYYYKWEFRTGMRGDFEYLVRLLQPKPLDKRVGKRYIDISNPGLEVPGINLSNPPVNHPDKHALEIEGALRHLNATNTEWPESNQDKFREKLVELLNLPSTIKKKGIIKKPVIVPPIYGQWHAGIEEVIPENKPENSWWLTQLNLDPRNRTIAEFATKVIQGNQESLMFEAWRQFGDVEMANQKILEAQAAKKIVQNFIDKKILPLEGNSLIHLTAPLHSRIVTELNGKEKITFRSYLNNSTIPDAVFDTSFRKVHRKRGGLRKRQLPNTKSSEDLLERLNKRDIRAAGDPPDIGGSGLINQVADRPWYAKGIIWKILKLLPIILLIAILVLGVIILILYKQNVPINNSHPLVIVTEVILFVFIVVQFIINPKGIVADSIYEQRITPELVEAAIPPGDFEDAENFRKLAMEFQKYLNNYTVGKTKTEANLKDTKAEILKEINPNKTLNKKLLRQINVNTADFKPDKLIYAYPDFPQPMYEPLRDLSQDYLLPGLEYIQQNTITLLETNYSFINSYMTGLNVEMANEFRWREYRTDLKCTPFRQFWNVSEVIMTDNIKNELVSKIEVDFKQQLDKLNQEQRESFIKEELEKAWREKLKDIQPIHKWGKTKLEDDKKDVVATKDKKGILNFFKKLFGNLFKKNDGSKEPKKRNLVLLIRGDLLKKYPTTIIYAIIGKWEKVNGKYKRTPAFEEIEKKSKDHPQVKYPIFKGTLKPDITFVGFDLYEEEAKGSTVQADNKPGWFFLIEERISESRFGMDAYIKDTPLPDDISKWDDLSQGHFYKEDGTFDLPPSNYIDNRTPRQVIDANEIKTYPWSSHAGNMAWITCQKPVRIAVHADDMIPENNKE